jgi:pyruvate ferredoxin oxidoreductase gamma subunit
MDAPLEIRVHGRGGQGAVTLAALLVDAAFESGWHVLGFPSFGTERTGAPVAAFVRLSRRPIRDRGEVRHPGLVVVQDPTLIGAVDVLEGLTPDGMVLINAAAVPEALRGYRTRALPATELAVQHLGVAKTSTAMLAFFAGATGIVSLEATVAAIRRRFSGELAERNEALAQAAFAAASEGRSAA